jgi:plastocyanin
VTLLRVSCHRASVAAVLGVLWWSVGPAAAAEARKPVTRTVTIDALVFLPAAITVNAGDTIVWVNKDPFPHTVTSKPGGFDSGTIAPGESWRYTLTKKGTFEYLCTFHPTMTATLRVR